MMNVAELETAKRLGLDLVVLLLRDNGYGMISWKQHDMQLPAFGLEFSNPDFVALAESFGVTGHRITQAGELSSILTEALNAQGVHIIDCPVDYSHNGDALGELLKKEVSLL